MTQPSRTVTWILLAAWFSAPATSLAARKGESLNISAESTMTRSGFTDSASLHQDLGDIAGIGNVVSGAGGSEFVSGNFPGAILMPVNLWGSVTKAGIHHIPLQTDLVTLLSYAGGPDKDAELDEVTIKRRSGDKEEILHVNVKEILTEVGVTSPALKPNDIILIPKHDAVLTNNILPIITVIGSVLSIVIAGFAVNAALNK